MKRMAFALWLLALISCASSHVMIGKARPPILASDVKLYLRPPAKFEEIALLESSSKSSWSFSDQGKMNKAIERLKEEAAKLGANGVLLHGSGDQYGGTIVTGSVETGPGSSTYSGIGMAAIYKSASGVAIFVEAE